MMAMMPRSCPRACGAAAAAAAADAGQPNTDTFTVIISHDPTVRKP